MKTKKISFSKIPTTLITLAALIILCIVLSIASPYFLTQKNLVNAVLQCTINATLACGMTFVILTGGIDLSVGSVVAFVGVMLGTFVKGGMALPLAIVLSILIGGVAGIINGLLVTKIKLPPFIATLGTMSIGRGLALAKTSGRSIQGLGSGMKFIGSGSILGIPVMILIMIVVFLVGMFILRYTRTGRYVYSVGGNLEATRLSGINTNKYIMFVYLFSGIMSGIAAVMLTGRLDAAQPVACEGYEMQAIAATVIGGTSMTGGEGRLSGTIVGALFISVLNNGLNLLNVSSYIQQIAIGLVIIFAVALDSLRSK